jgi:putative aldouronate transport system permease protein
MASPGAMNIPSPMERIQAMRGIQLFFREIKKNLPLYLMFLPGFLLLALFCYLPMFGVIVAFKNVNYVDGIWGSPFVGLENFKFLFSGPDAFLITRNTVLYNLVFTLVGVVLPVAFAIGLNELRQRRAAKVYQGILFVPYFISWVIVTYILYSFINPQYGFLNMSVFPALGIAPYNFYAEKAWWPFLFVFFNAWKYVGYNTVIYLAALTGISPEYYEAAAIDGAGKWKQATRVTLPHLRPMMTVLTILAAGRIFTADFGMFFNLPLNSGLLQSVTNVLDVYVYNTLVRTGDIGMSAAAGLYQGVIGCVLVVAANAFVKRLEAESALF